MPAEWEPHEATWLAWPYDPITFANRMERVEQTFGQIIQALHVNERVELLIRDNAMRKRVEKIFKEYNIDSNRVRLHQTDYADVWFRDYGPTFVEKNGSPKTTLIDWEYNAYGEKFPDLFKDNFIPGLMNTFLKLPIASPGIVMESGSFDTNGNGTLLTTRQCLLNKNRNPSLSQKKIESHLKKYLGVSHIIWLNEGIVNDHTDGHIDDVARFVDENTVVCAYEEDEHDSNYALLDEDYRILTAAKTADGEPLTVLKLPMPRQVDENGERQPASYANFYIANCIVLLPTFNQPSDAKALDILQSAFPNRRVIGIDCCDLVYGGGTIHCMTQQQPAL